MLKIEDFHKKLIGEIDDYPLRVINEIVFFLKNGEERDYNENNLTKLFNLYGIAILKNAEISIGKHEQNSSIERCLSCNTGDEEKSSIFLMLYAIYEIKSSLFIGKNLLNFYRVMDEVLIWYVSKNKNLHRRAKSHKDR